MKYLIWSIEHNAWWKPNECGYIDDIKRAGLYSKEEANRIIKQANRGSFNECMIPGVDVREALDEGKVIKILNDSCLRSGYKEDSKSDLEEIPRVAQAICKKFGKRDIEEARIVETLKLINRIAQQRYKWPRNSNEDNEGWLKVAEITAKAIKKELEV